MEIDNSDSDREDHKENKSVPVIEGKEAKQGGRRRRFNVAGSSAHEFSLVDKSRSDIVEMAHFFGFSVEESCDSIPAFSEEKAALMEGVPSDHFDLRWIATAETQLRISQPTTLDNDMNRSVVGVPVTREPTESADECMFLFGPRGSNEDSSFPVGNLVCREQAERRLHVLSPALRSVVSKVRERFPLLFTGRMKRKIKGKLKY